MCERKKGKLGSNYCTTAVKIACYDSLHPIYMEFISDVICVGHAKLGSLVDDWCTYGTFVSDHWSYKRFVDGLQ